MSKKIMIAFVIGLTLTAVAQVSAQAVPGTTTIVISNLPANIQEFVSMRDRLAVSPAGGAASFIVAMLIYTKNIELGTQCMTASLVNDPALLRRVSPGGYEGLEPLPSMQREITVLQREPWIADSYVFGTSVNNGYKLSGGPYRIVFNPYNPQVGPDGVIYLQVYSSGVATPRNISVRANNHGLWKVWDWTEVIKSVRAPAAYLYYEDDI